MVPLALASQPPNGILIGLAIFALCNRHTVRQMTLHVTSVAIGSICAVMQSKNVSGCSAFVHLRSIFGQESLC